LQEAVNGLDLKKHQEKYEIQDIAIKIRRRVAEKPSEKRRIPTRYQEASNIQRISFSRVHKSNSKMRLHKLILSITLCLTMHNTPGCEALIQGNAERILLKAMGMRRRNWRLNKR